MSLAVVCELLDLSDDADMRYALATNAHADPEPASAAAAVSTGSPAAR
ncbi:MAG: hypothetical protein M3P53_00405 [Actinomycetota bacterium]|nr:hypothetical protein [Actinomycetota bacterium]